ncbi:Protein kinase [Quillaja saponaria]|uniref:mitogen-activated protein kinase kinase kinase n=1 Tax=Quillaja saponaria TaxID=32244 RepID=A0AAD7M192_QUISA|nr:Protein kinase [Quillaja saponaria]KAJ7968107.1 Protein kinase [Quillaja saponaria]
MEAKQKRGKPKLERRNAIKNIDYVVPENFTSGGNSSNIRTRSLDLYPLLDHQTSFRVEGTTEGEFDLICRNLGLSPDDFSIPTAAWEAQKARSSSYLATRSRSLDCKTLSEDEISAKLGSEVGLNRIIELDFECSQSKSGSGLFCDGGKDKKLYADCNFVGHSMDGGGGIKGVRPPVLAPPPVMLAPVVDHVSSTWDILKSFAPQDDSVVNSPVCDGGTCSYQEQEEEVNEGNDVQEELNGIRHGETDVLSDLNSSTSHDDNGIIGNASGVIPDSVYIISPSGKFRRSFSSWQKGGLLGSGSFGTVYEGFTDDGFFFAVKEVSLLDQGNHGKQRIFQLQQEISLLSQFEHENIVKYLGTDKNNTTLFIFLELVTKGSLANLYQKYHLRDSQVSAYTRQILSGLKYLHDRNVVHRDIKCGNILVHASGFVKLADFGLAKATKLNDVKSSKGTPFWMAPEVVNLKQHGYGLAADIWSLGCTVLEMLTRQPPYSHLEGMQALFRIGRGELPLVPDSLSKDARDFICKCLQVNPNNRPTAAQLSDHPFLKKPLQSSSGPASTYLSAF